MQKIIDDFLSQRSYAVAGSFKDETKYAYKIFRKLRGISKTVFPVNPGIKEIDGVKVYGDICDITEKVDVLNLVTAPAVSLKHAKKCHELGITKIWFQPGAENEEVLRFCTENGITALHGVCVLVETK